MVLYASRNPTKITFTVNLLKKQEEEAGVSTWEKWQEFAKRTFVHRDQFLDLLGSPAIGWGASARSSTLLNFCQIGTDQISSIIDNNSIKQGRFTAGTHIPIEAAQKVMAKNPESVCVLAWNFLREIAVELRKQYKFTGDLIVPFPVTKNPQKYNIREVCP